MYRLLKGAFLTLALAGAVLSGCGGGGSERREDRQELPRKRESRAGS